jgi:hypothetical protein
VAEIVNLPIAADFVGLIGVLRELQRGRHAPQICALPTAGSTVDTGCVLAVIAPVEYPSMGKRVVTTGGVAASADLIKG